MFATQLEGLPILRVMVTHMHPDHIGLAHWLCERWDAPLWISATDFNVARMASQSTVGFGGDDAAAFFALHGLTDPASLEKIRGRASYYPSMVPQVPRTYRRLQDGDRVAIGGRSWRCISGYGHAPEHIALYCDDLKVLISGDMMLPRISTNVSVYDVEPESNPLRQFLESIDKFAALPPDTLTLPSHGKPFRGLHERIRQLHEHHDARLAEVIDACAGRAVLRRRRAARAVQARTRPAPDHVRHGRIGRPPARALVRRASCGATRARTASCASRSALSRASRRQVVRQPGRRRGFRQREVERRAFAQHRFGPDAALVARDDAPHRGQPDAGAREFRLGVQALEGAEQLARVGHVEARPRCRARRTRCRLRRGPPRCARRRAAT